MREFLVYYIVIGEQVFLESTRTVFSRSAAAIDVTGLHI